MIISDLFGMHKNFGEACKLRFFCWLIVESFSLFSNIFRVCCRLIGPKLQNSYLETIYFLKTYKNPPWKPLKISHKKPGECAAQLLIEASKT